MLLIRERIVVALPKGHKAARKRAVGLRDLEGELFIIPLEGYVAESASTDCESLRTKSRAVKTNIKWWSISKLR
jgi:hypothetical protein